MIKEGKKYPCEQCAEGTYMTVEAMWWCNKHLMYACGVERNRGLCEKFNKTTSKNDAASRQAILAIERYQDLVDYFDDEDVAKTILESREGFKQWLARIRWHVEKADELARKLDQKPCEDAISKEDVIKAIDRHTFDTDDGLCLDEDISIILEELASVTPASKKCHNENKDYDDCDQFVCSNCGIELQDWHAVERSEDDGDITYHEYEFRFCPNCGARIVKEE